MSNWPVALADTLVDRFEAAFDRAGKIGRALESLGPVKDRDCVVVDAAGGPIRRSLAELGARIVDAPLDSPFRLPIGDASADCVIGLWSAFRGVVPEEVAEADRVLRTGGRLLVIHDYGRDDVSRIRGSLPEYGAWTRKNGPFLSGGFRIRVVHCFWDFDSADETGTFLAEAFGEAGTTVASTLKRPRLSYNVAIYHRSKPAPGTGAGPAGRLRPAMQVGRFRLTPISLVVAIAFIGAAAFISVAILKVRDTSQIPMLSSGFAILGLAFAAVAVGALIQLWRAAATRRLGRAMGLAVLGGLLGLAAIGCFTATVVLALLWKSG